MSRRFSEMDQVKIDCAQRYVDHIEELRGIQDEAETKIAVIMSMAMPGAMRYDDVNVCTSPTDDTIPNAVAALEDVSDLEYLIQQIEDERAEFLTKVRFGVKGVGGTFLYTHFKYGIDYKTIADTAGLDASTERIRRKEALIEMYDKELLPQQYMLPIQRAI